MVLDAVAKQAKPAGSRSLDAAANDLAKGLKEDLELYKDGEQKLEALLSALEGLRTKIDRSAKAISVLTGTDLPLPEWYQVHSSLEADEPAAISAPASPALSGSGVVQAIPIPISPPPPKGMFCSGCGGYTLEYSTITTSKGRQVHVYACQDSSCNATYPA